MTPFIDQFKRFLLIGLCLPTLPLAAFEITSLEVTETETTLAWEGGSPPYQVQISSDLSNWTDLGAAQDTTSITLPRNQDESRFYRVIYQVEPQPASPIEIVSGSFEVPQFRSTSDPNYHTFRSITGQLPADLPDTAGRQLTIVLFDIDNPDLSCEIQHPLEGCTTIDWDDFQGVPNVPLSGYFDNSFTTRMGGEETKLFLRQDLSLSLVNNSHPIQ